MGFLNFRYEKLVSGVKKFDTEGLNSLKYRIKYLEHKILYTWILVEIRQDSVSNDRNSKSIMITSYTHTPFLPNCTYYVPVPTTFVRASYTF